MKSSGGFECWYVGFGGEIPQHMQVFCTRDAVKKKGKGLFSITILCCTYVFATEPLSSCSWRRRRCRMCSWAAPREKRTTFVHQNLQTWIQLEKNPKCDAGASSKHRMSECNQMWTFAGSISIRKHSITQHVLHKSHQYPICFIKMLDAPFSTHHGEKSKLAGTEPNTPEFGLNLLLLCDSQA